MGAAALGMTTKRLIDLNPRWMERPDGVKIGVTFDCPNGDPGHEVGVYFTPPIGGVIPDWMKKRLQWKRTGDTFETLTLEPSLHALDGCGWHGFVTNGQVLPA